MPYFKIETNKSLDASLAQDFAKEASSFACRLLGKPVQYMMVSVHHGVTMTFAGTLGPAAYIELKAIGLAEGQCQKYSKSICEFVESTLEIPPDRVYIDFKNIEGPMFGWNKSTF